MSNFSKIIDSFPSADDDSYLKKIEKDRKRQEKINRLLELKKKILLEKRDRIKKE